MFLQFIRKKDYFIGDEGRRWRKRSGRPKKPGREVSRKMLIDKRLHKMPAARTQQAFYVINYDTATYRPPIKDRNAQAS